MLKENKIYCQKGYGENNQEVWYVFKHLYYAPVGHPENPKHDNSAMPVSETLGEYITKTEALAAYPEAHVLSPYGFFG